MPIPSLEQQARQKVRIAVRMLADAQRLYEEGGRAYAGPGLNAEVLAHFVEELTDRLAEAERLAPSGS
jgi:predicted metal-dependent hydrolase